MAWFLNHYQCPCGETWSDQWSCTCNDRCPGCNAEIEPTCSDDLTIDVHPAATRGYDVVVSPDTAEHSADYWVEDTFESKEAAEVYAALRREGAFSSQP